MLKTGFYQYKLYNLIKLINDKEKYINKAYLTYFKLEEEIKKCPTSIPTRKLIVGSKAICVIANCYLLSLQDFR